MVIGFFILCFFFSSRRRHTRLTCDWSSDVCSSDLAIRSGENGFFTVADADSLYRTMRVASASELGLMLATIGLLGDDRKSPWFPDNVCYYDETDNARQV